MLEWMERPHRRLNPLTGEWVLVSAQRTNRPWQGKLERPAEQNTLSYDPQCYLCPGNARAGGVRNPQYATTFVFDNDFPALLPDDNHGSLDQQGLLLARSERGICKVICFSPKHNLAIPSMELDALTTVIETWRDVTRSLAELPFIRYAQLFENRGPLMGASNPHPHCQVWGVESLPNEIGKEEAAQSQYLDQHNACLLCNYSALEGTGERTVCENDFFRVVVPFWAIWPFETMVIAKTHVPDLPSLPVQQLPELGQILRNITRRYDALFGVPFPYSMGFHQRPAQSIAPESWHLHAHFYPPLLRSAEIRKFMVGFELLAGPARDITPESAASRLRDVHP